jgi:molecular chaperone DnaJ
MSDDYYITLGISRNANLNKIKGAYHQKVKQYHPDTSYSKETSKQFMEIKEAYDTLSNEKKRKAYDEELSRQGSSIPANTPIHDVDETIRRKRSIFERYDDFFDDTDDFFGGFVHGFFERGLGRDKDLYIEVLLTPREAFEGCLIPLTVPVMERCPQCNGIGYWEYFYCPDCLGRGRIEAKREFSLATPPHVRSGTEVRVSLEDIGLKNHYLNVAVRTEKRHF